MSIIPQNSFYFKNPKFSTSLHLKPLKSPLYFPIEKPNLLKIKSLQCHQWKIKAFESVGTVKAQSLAEFEFKNPIFSTPLDFKPFKTRLCFPTQKPHLLKIESLQCHQWKVKAFESEGSVKEQSLAEFEFNIDAFLSILEFLCLFSSAVVAIGYAVNSWFWGSQKWLGNRVLGAQCVVLVGGVIIGSVIRRRQWSRICTFEFSSRSGSGSRGVNLVERIEKLEEDLRSSATLIRVLSRQLEKLGIRFRVTRKTLKDPVTEAAALAQKNSEATRALALQGERLEKELGEIQKVLLAMQEQQHKQLELILAIGKTGKLFENKRGPSQEPAQNTSNVSNTAVDGVSQLEVNRLQSLKGHRETNNDRC
ncbi:uncharacterized protein LOC107810358 [Nicotiana tabacum]|uniref:Uncharacterized protein LOC107810358 n=2 Tax=Nicotiana TaxID=4085 RepID=A0A1S4BP06_TOBAC|nr:PREDICTED: uncharacterized protein LOC104248030 [Nicotiana sylvestris]XP_016490604.1 PREDICTED: uncharacterized protein LOC107810358 [Nicotiana tabacum]